MSQTTLDITVPDISAHKLIKLAQKQLKLPYLHGDLAKWDFYKNQKGEVVDVGGKTYEVRSWKPVRTVVPATDVRKHFTNGFVGNTAAFIALVMRDNLQGHHASIPMDNRLFLSGGIRFRWGGGYPSALCFICDKGVRSLHLSSDVRCGWGDGVCYWAFREVPA